MTVTLKQGTPEDAPSLIALCNAADRTWLSGWLPNPYTEAARQICAQAFAALPVARITGRVFAPNTASRRVLEKNGFRLEGIRKNGLIKNGALYDLCIYGLCRPE